MLILQDWLLFIGHVLLIVFNMVGWIWKRTRKLHLITISLTAFSWIVLGAVYGWGYCFFTDYHAEVLEHLGHADGKRPTSPGAAAGTTMPPAPPTGLPPLFARKGWPGCKQTGNWPPTPRD